MGFTDRGKSMYKVTWWDRVLGFSGVTGFRGELERQVAGS